MIFLFESVRIVVNFEAMTILICHVNCNYTYNKNLSPSSVIAILFRSGLLLNQLFNQLLFLNEKCPHNPILDTICAARATISTLHSLLVLGKTGVFTRTKGGNLQKQY